VEAMKEIGGRRPKVGLSVWLLCTVGLGTVYFPLLLIVSRSFQVAPPSVSVSVFGSLWTLKWYESLFANTSLGPSLWLSFKIAVLSSSLSLVVGTWTALTLVRSKGPLKAFLLTGIHSILVLPDLVLGIALLIWFSFCKIGLGPLSMILAHATFSLSYAVLSVAARLRSMDPYLIDAAKDLGASRWQFFWWIVFPWLKPALASAAFLSFIFSFDDFVLSFLLSDPSPESQTLPLQLYAMARHGVTGELYALATLLLSVTFLSVFFLVGMGKYRTAKETPHLSAVRNS